MFSQQYHITRVETHSPAIPALNFDHPYSCQMFVQTLFSASCVISKPGNPLAGIFALNRMSSVRMPLKLKSICYFITAKPEDRPDTLHSQEFIHKCYGVVLMLLSGELRAGDGVLFKRFPLNDLLDTDDFPGVSGVQFIA